MTIVTKTQLAEKFGVHTSTIDKYQHLGMPLHERGNRRKGESTYDLEACVQWKEEQFSDTEQSESMQEARLRKLQAEASLAELELEKQKGTVVAIEDVAAELAGTFATIKTRVLALSSKLPGLLIGKQSEREMQDVIDRELRIVLIELASHYEQAKEEESQLIATTEEDEDKPDTIQEETT